MDNYDANSKIIFLKNITKNTLYISVTSYSLECDFRQTAYGTDNKLHSIKFCPR